MPETSPPESVSAAEFQRRYGSGAAVEQAPQIRLSKPAEMNKTEAAYMQRLRVEYPGHLVMYEPISFRLPSGTRYTPDFIVWKGNEIHSVHETKGGHIHNPASIRAFKEARAAFPMLRFVFAQLRKTQWTVTE